MGTGCSLGRTSLKITWCYAGFWMLAKRQKTGGCHTRWLVVAPGHPLQYGMPDSFLWAVFWPGLKMVERMCQKALRLQTQLIQRQLVDIGISFFPLSSLPWIMLRSRILKHFVGLCQDFFIDKDTEQRFERSCSFVSLTDGRIGSFPNFTTRDSRPGRVMCGPSVPVASKSWQRRMLRMNSFFGKAS